MNTIVPYIKPIVDLWHSLTEDQEFKELTENRQDWHTKFLNNERWKLNEEFKEE